MRKLYILLALLVAMMTIGEVSAQRSKANKRRHAKTHKVVKKHHRTKKKAVKKRTAVIRPVDPRLNDPDYDPNIMCEDTCGHVHGIDLSHYQG